MVQLNNDRATKTNRNITAEKVLLVFETKDGAKEHTLVSRQQALDAAEAANLDLVQGKLRLHVGRGRRHTFSQPWAFASKPNPWPDV